MPSVSKKQHNLMALVANDPKAAKRLGIKQSVGEEFIKADKGRKFGTGGDVNRTIGGNGMINKQRTRYGSELGYEKNVPNISLNKYVGKKEGGTVAKMKHDDIVEDKKLVKKAIAMHDKQEHPGRKTDMSKLKKGGNVKKMAFGGLPSQAAPQAAVGMANRPAMPAQAGNVPRPPVATGQPMKKGGKVKKMAFGGLPSQAAPQAATGMANRPAMPAQANTGGAQTGLSRAGAMSGREMPSTGRPMKKGGSTKCMAKGGSASKRADGCAQRGKTKGKII